MKNLRNLFLILISLSVAACVKDTPGPGSSGVRVSVRQQALFTASGNVLYAYTKDGLAQYDATNATGLTAVKTTTVTGIIPTTLTSGSNYIYTAGAGNFNIYNTTTGTPTLSATYSDYQGCAPVAVNGNYAFITERLDSYCGSIYTQLKVVDISNPAKPVLIKAYPLSSPAGIAVDGNNLFICDKGLKYYDASNPANLVLKLTLPIASTTLAAQNGKLAAAGPDGLYQFDYSTGALVQISKLKLN
ncbi:LVIVD repeat-containing protein [Mucilaginibacter yixingensis]|uniref:LVIVD repeat-containing protein n=1 Tax=Mucilaginibacter yixingensis TaxID=1295612 RepID=A0A2T5J8P7_9SPHI|nr:hypothetical protein [Mucilaginibacter yixingensis]PTQ95838.1 LVIVD repeat-containing protein [Mucilaginibacter yixingensis]